MGDVIRPEPPQWEEQEEIMAWRRHRERQRRPLVYNPETKTFRPERQKEPREILFRDEALIAQVMRDSGMTREEAIRELLASGM
jgi:hypothetical protein